MKTFTRRFGASKRSGAILGMMLVMVLALSLIGMGLLWLGRDNGVEVSRHVSMNRAFWAAESGIQHARAELHAHPTSYTTPLTRESSNGWSYIARITPISPPLYSIVSTGIVMAGTADEMRRAVQENVTVIPAGWPDAFYYTLFGGGGAMNIGKAATIVTGSVYQIGDVSFQKNPTITNGYVYATGDVSGFTKTDPPDPSPQMPGFDATVYSNAIAVAASSTNTTMPSSLGGVGTTNYVNGPVPITSLSGAGTLVVNGDVSLNLNSGSSLASNVNIISNGQVTFAKDTQTGGSSIIYASNGFYFGKDCNLIATAVLISPQGVSTDSSSAKNFTFTGAIYCGGQVVMDKNATITGAIVAEGGFDIKKTLVATWVDPSQLIGLQPPIGIESEVNVNDVHWQQL